MGALETQRPFLLPFKTCFFNVLMLNFYLGCMTHYNFKKGKEKDHERIKTGKTKNRRK
jgi:hypothetical protein